jgi:hypothetical protein
MTRAQCEAMAKVLRAASDEADACARIMQDFKDPALAAYFAQASICKALADAYDAAAKVAPAPKPGWMPWES